MSPRQLRISGPRRRYRPIDLLEAIRVGHRTVPELARLLEVPPRIVHRSIDRLMSARLIARDPSRQRGRGRVQLWTLTERGHAALLES